MEYFVYILKSEVTDQHYVGQTNDLNKRLARHNSGKNKSTKVGRPWRLVYYEQHESRSAAFKREQQIKSYKGGEAFKKLIG